MEIGDLNEPAGLLLENAQTLDSSSEISPQIPNAGPSTALVGDAIAVLARAMSDLVVASARAADSVQACDEDYTDTDHTTAAAIAGTDTQTGSR